MTDLERLVSQALSIRAQEAMMETDAATSAQELAHRLDAEDRRRRMTWAAVAAVAAVAVVVVGFGVIALRGSSSHDLAAGPASTSPPATKTALTRSYTSALYGYTVSLPATWTASHVATRWWASGTDNTAAGNEDVNDVYVGPDRLGLNVAVQKVPKGTTLHTYVGDKPVTDVPLPKCFPAYSGWIPVTVGGYPARYHGGLDGCDFTEAVVIVGDRAYQISATPDRDRGGLLVFDEDLFTRILAAMRLPASPTS